MSCFEIEYQELKSDLRELKVCQRQYFFVAISGAAALLTLAKYFDNGATGYLLLSPLLLILPCWLMFFDKATTITRITGYVRMLEKIISAPENTYKFNGYETSASIFRTKETNKEFLEFEERDLMILPMPWNTRYRYWRINWYTYWSLSVLSCVAAAVWNSQDKNNIEGIWWLIGSAGVVVLYLWLLTIKVLNQLSRGKYSYDNMYNSWSKFLPERSDENT